MTTRSTLRRNSAWGWLFWIPAAVVAAVGLWRLCSSVYYSFTYFNVLELPRFIGLQNYKEIAQNEVIRLCLSNTLLITFLVGGALMLISGSLGLLTARLPLPCGIALGGLFTLVSLFAMFPVGWSHIFSLDAHGLLNGWLMETHLITEPIPWTTQYAFWIHALLLFAICLAPVYFIVYLCARRKSRQLGLTIAFAAIPVLMVIGWHYINSLTGYPSADYAADWLPSLILDYGNTRVEIGMSSALVITGLGLWLVWCALGILLIWGGATAYRRIRPRIPAVLRWIAFVLGGSGALWLLFPAFVAFQDAFKPMSELFVIPPSLFVEQPSAEGTQLLLELMNGEAYPSLTDVFSRLWLLPLCYLLTVLPAAVGLTQFSYRGQKFALYIWLGVWALLSLASQDTVHWFIIRPDFRLVPSDLFSFFRGPFYPLSLLTTIWILRTGLGGARRLWISTGICIAVQALSVTIWRLLYVYPFIYYGTNKTFAQILQEFPYGGLARINMTAVGTLVLVASVMLPILLLTVACLYLRHARKKADA